MFDRLRALIPPEQDKSDDAAFGGDHDLNAEHYGETDDSTPLSLDVTDDIPFRIAGAIHKAFDGLGHELRVRGVEVKKVDGWESRGHEGTFDPRGVLEHHTASATGSDAPAIHTVTFGRPDLPGPLCNFLVSRSGIVYFIASGRAYHAGLGGPFRGIPLNSGNSYLWGIEIENNGVGEKYPGHQMFAVRVLTKLLLTRSGNRGAFMAFGHKEWTSRKIDPSLWKMDQFRHDVKRTSLKKLDARKDV